MGHKKKGAKASKKRVSTGTKRAAAKGPIRSRGRRVTVPREGSIFGAGDPF